MSDTYLALTQIENLFKDVTVDMIGGSPPVDVRISWPTGGAPAWKITEDIIFLRIMEADDAYNRKRETEYEESSPNLNQKTSYTRVNAIYWILYGPNSYENAQILRDRIFNQDTRNTLAQSNIFLIPDISSPRRIPELYNGQWWSRADLNMRFNELVIKNIEVNPIDILDIEIDHEDSTSETIEINLL